MEKSIELKSMKLLNGETLGFRELGDGDKTILYIHGNMTSSKHWDVLLEKMPLEDYKVYAIDMRGFGASSYQQPIESIKDLADDIKYFVDDLKLQNLTIVGWSLGGAVAMRFTIDYQQYVEKLVLLQSSSIQGFPLEKRTLFGKGKGQYVKTKKEMEKECQPLVKAFEKNRKWFFKLLANKSMYNIKKPEKKKYEEYLEDMCTQRNIVDVNYALINFNISNKHNHVVEGTGEIEKITVPTLIIHGDQDKVVPLEKAKETKEAIGDHAKLMVLENCGHSPLVSHLDELSSIIIDFVNLENE